eukprot:TRINITY_DN933_c0_g1_i14.p1 TRINITY_DN933_c0_g1~~TRINITY_DN933_c0_g1_i14.p1  ORF type:complete len:339 (-),score=41.13 TRINITY_DN933_c0_g1_i14:131-1084(-)
MAPIRDLVVFAVLPSLLLGWRLRGAANDQRLAFEKERIDAILTLISKPLPLVETSNVSTPYDGLTHYNYSRRHSTHGLTAYEELPACKFDSSPPAFPAWSASDATLQAKFLTQLHDANVTSVLTFGTLLGAYRHHGTIPFDIDMDMVFSVCENIHLVRQSSSRFKEMSCQEIGAARASMNETEFGLELWTDVLSPVLKDITMADHTVGGIRLSNGGDNWNGLPGGIGVDFLIIVVPLTERVKSRDLCKCTFGNTFGYCNTNSKHVLTKMYGTDFMVPKSQCDYYTEIGHPEWGWRSRLECQWASDAIAKKNAESGNV